MNLTLLLGGLSHSDTMLCRSAGGIKQTLVRVAVVAKFVEHEFGQPVGRVVFTQVVADGTVPDKMVRQLIHHLLGATDPGRGIPPAELGRVLDAIEKRLHKPELERWWMDHLVIAACSQYALDDPDGILGLTHARFGRLAGKDAPEGAEREPTLLWTAWVGARRGR